MFVDPEDEHRTSVHVYVAMCVCDCMALVITFHVAMLTVYEIFITFITHKPLAIRTAATLAAVSVDSY